MSDADAKKLGIIGGLGPLATAHFYRRIVELTPAGQDQSHIETLIYSCPQVPDRTAFLLGKSTEDPRPKMIEVGKSLVASGAEVLAIPCVTAHAFHKELEEGIGHPVLHAIRELGKECNRRHIESVGIMATDGARQSRVYETTLEEYGVKCFWPDENGQKTVMRMIYEYVKAGQAIPETIFCEVSEHLLAQGAQAIVLGCTELSQLTISEKLGHQYLDIIDVLAKACVDACFSRQKEISQ